MNEPTVRHDRSSWAVGGGTLVGMGVGFFFMPEDRFAFVGCMMLGIGVGLFAAAILSRFGR